MEDRGDRSDATGAGGDEEVLHGEGQGDQVGRALLLGVAGGEGVAGNAYGDDPRGDLHVGPEDLLGVRRGPPRVVAGVHAVRGGAHRGEVLGAAVDDELGEPEAEIGFADDDEAPGLCHAARGRQEGEAQAFVHDGVGDGPVRVRADTASQANGVIYVQARSVPRQLMDHRGDTQLGDHRDVFAICGRTRRSGQRSVIWVSAFPGKSPPLQVSDFCAR